MNTASSSSTAAIGIAAATRWLGMQSQSTERQSSGAVSDVLVSTTD
jgi:hypothetical protein